MTESHDSSQMAFPTKSQLLELKVEGLKDNTVTDFDIFLVIDGKPTLYAKSPYRWFKDELERLLRSGHRSLYYDTRDQDKFEVYKKVITIPLNFLGEEPRKRVNLLTDAAAELTRILYEHKLSDALLDKGNQIAKSLVECVKEDPYCVVALGRLAHHDYYTYYHSSRVAAYALSIALQLSVSEDLLLNELAIGCLFHDIGKNEIELSVLNKTGALTEVEWGLLRKHPESGHQQIQASLLSHAPREIVLHHHERLDGVGYPHHLTANEILQEVRIAAFSDVFDALTTNRPYHASRSRFEALDFIKFKLSSQLDRESFKAMVEILKNAEKNAG